MDEVQDNGRHLILKEKKEAREKHHLENIHLTMNNPLNINPKKLKELIKGYLLWLESEPKEKEYPEILRKQSKRIREEFLNMNILTQMLDDEFYEKIFKYSRELEGPVHIRLGEQRIRDNLQNLRRNLEYIITSKDSPFYVAQNILEGDYKIEIFSKAFWSPIFQARFPGVLPNWNNKTERFFKKFGIKLSTSKLSIEEKYKILSEIFTFLSEISEGQDFYTINHMMHYGTEVPEGIKLVDEITGKETSDPIAELIKEYKKKIRKAGLKDELYKWELIQKYKGRPDIDAVDFKEEIRTLDFKNLIYPIATMVKNHIVSELPEEYRNCFTNLFDETQDLTSRVKKFMDDVMTIYRKLEPKQGHHHDERTISLFLTYHNPDKYTFFKDTYYQNYCRLTGEIPRHKGEKYAHYMKLVKSIRDKYILQDIELLTLINSELTQECFADENHLILVQDILFQMLDNESKKGRNYWRIGTTDGKNKYWDLMLSERFVSIGWPELGNLNEKGIEHKDDMIKLMTEIGYYNNKAITSKKAGEVYDFLKNINIGDVILAQEGSQIKGIGIVTGEYNYQEKLNFPHTISVDWIVISPSLKNNKGLQTTVKKMTDPYLIQEIDTILTENKKNKTVEAITSLNTILFGPPGTGKTYHTIDLAVKIVAPDLFVKMNHSNNKKIFNELIKQGQIAFITFHQSMSYEDFIEGIKPLSPEENDSYLKYNIEDGIFKRISATAATPNQTNFNKAFKDLQTELYEKGIIHLNTPTGREFSISLNRNGNLSLHTGKEKKIQGTLTKENIQKHLQSEDVFDYWQGYFQGVIDFIKKKYNYQPESVTKLQNYVLIIDEINRGNIAQIFGELITLIEEDKRKGNREELEVILPYSKERFSVPSNLYIIGTMNTADRSIEALDTALRRRFSFREMAPDSNLIRTIGKAKENNGIVDGIDLVKLLNTINVRIEKLLDKDHMIGHSYFLNVGSHADLVEVFKNKVIPLLEEYFYGDYGKIGLILGKHFVSEDKEENEEFSFAGFDYDEDILTDLKERKVYHISDPGSWTVPAFQSVYKKQEK